MGVSWILLIRLHGIEFEEINISVTKGQQFTPEYKGSFFLEFYLFVLDVYICLCVGGFVAYLIWLCLVELNLEELVVELFRPLNLLYPTFVRLSCMYRGANSFDFGEGGSLGACYLECGRILFLRNCN